MEYLKHSRVAAWWVLGACCAAMLAAGSAAWAQLTPAQEMALRRENEVRMMNSPPPLLEMAGGAEKLLAVAARGTPAAAAQISLPYQFSNSQGDSFVISTQGYIQSQNN